MRIKEKKVLSLQENLSSLNIIFYLILKKKKNKENQTKRFFLQVF